MFEYTGSPVHFSRDTQSFHQDKRKTHFSTVVMWNSLSVRQREDLHHHRTFLLLYHRRSWYLLTRLFLYYLPVRGGWKDDVYQQCWCYIYSVIFWSFMKEYKYIDHTVFNPRFVLYSFPLWLFFPLFSAALFPTLSLSSSILFCFLWLCWVYIVQGGRRAGSSTQCLGDKHITVSFVLLARGTFMNCGVDRFSV